MSVYVDPLMPSLVSTRWPWPAACHLFADTWAELHHFAAMIGLKHSWFQYRPGKLPHYDLNASMRGRAVAAGAIELTDRLELLRAYARCSARSAAVRLRRCNKRESQAHESPA